MDCEALAIRLATLYLLLQLHAVNLSHKQSDISGLEISHGISQNMKYATKSHTKIFNDITVILSAQYGHT